MLTPAFLAGCAENVVEIYSQVEQDILADIARRIVKNGYITSTAEWQLQKAREFGYLQEDVSQILAEATGKSTREIRKLMKRAGVKALAVDDAIYRAAGLQPLDLFESPALAAMLLQGTDTTLALVGNYTKTTAKVATMAYNSVLDRAFTQILSGAFDPNTAIKMAIKEVVSNGIEKIAYPSGSHVSVESGIRRAVVTGINQATSRIQLERANEMGCELVEVSSHAGARPSHAEWQGQVYSLHGRKGSYPDFYAATGYGSGDGLCGWNCYHNFYPFFEGISSASFVRDPSAQAGRNNDEDYELQQRQRYYERQVRAAKKECLVYNEAIDSAQDDRLKRELQAEFDKSAAKLKRREKSLRSFINENDLTRYNDREYVASWDRSMRTKVNQSGRRK